MIFINYNYDGLIQSIVSAKNESAAMAYWQGKGILPHTHTTFDTSEKRENEELGFVTPILNTEVKTLGSWSHEQKYIVVTKKD